MSADLEKMVIRSIKSVLEVNQLLNEFNNAFRPTLTERIIDLKMYAEKIVDKGYVYAAFHDKEILGFIVFYANDRVTKTGYLTQIAIKRDCSIKGIGFELVMLFERKCFDFGMENLRLEVSNNNPHAISFYRKCGYNFDGKASESTIFMSKKIIIKEVQI